MQIHQIKSGSQQFQCFWHAFLATKFVLFQNLKTDKYLVLDTMGFVFIFHTFCMYERDFFTQYFKTIMSLPQISIGLHKKINFASEFIHRSCINLVETLLQYLSLSGSSSTSQDTNSWYYRTRSLLFFRRYSNIKD